MGRHRHARSASADDLLTQLGRLTARAREEIEVQRARVELAEALQRGMLPSTLPTADGLRVAARYSPARDGLDIGGDWYDGFRLPDGTLAFSIGDVQGHDVEAAAYMGQIRIVLRAVAATGTANPGHILHTANELLLAMDNPLFATCGFLRFDPVTWRLEAARAGHTGSVYARADGTSGIVQDEGGLPLAVQGDEPYPVTRHRLTQPGALALLTDGVVEGPTFALEEGLAEVERVLREGVHEEPDTLADRVMEVAEKTGHTDDAAVLVLCYDGPEACHTAARRAGVV
ncbi:MULTISPECIES: PP2C family protein-serine/threonine phosphatase [unclassified Streptomyces]|uniref:PP2C family protein-serine/threonine phosphatase n=1 Tax=unclassified Streptomyces TaxID=2593676 RepID=UPI002DD85D00|nr:MULTISPECIES: PP2C family protein-serine/threonine phosphatase [unclassified Streptomyces]WSA91877.1 serine/threonine-protein phosphatase [Streptomyces sp. NBC_01795]WSB76245.1 serine/threonine-protein phosphatase [Streptomyces sp. NBC_01775]WSS15480.1 serine/threonine-protein phosphatase [Streptomyces sp. NBC_01186]WSS44322.1 serine/threonine-protein phosphatase [Streptomyces sp. NBC_01187]